MKAICQCNCAVGSGFSVNPWCAMLNRLNNEHADNVLHLWYKLSVLREEVEKRTSYLGKLRKSEDAPHLLDLISMTDDESDLFYPFARDAAADVFDMLSLYTFKRQMAYFWDEGRGSHTITMDALPTEPVENPVTFQERDWIQTNDALYVALADGDMNNYLDKIMPSDDYREAAHYIIPWTCKTNINMFNPLDTAIFEALVARIIFKWVSYAYPDAAPSFLEEYNNALNHVRSRCRDLFAEKIVHRIPRSF